jgi:hypothetical protein
LKNKIERREIMMEEFKKDSLDLTGRHITLDMLIEVIKDYADLS